MTVQEVLNVLLSADEDAEVTIIADCEVRDITRIDVDDDGTVIIEADYSI